MAPSVPPLPSGQTGGNSALMTATNVHVASLQMIVRVRAGLESQGCTNAQFASSGARLRSFVGTLPGKRRDERRVVRVGALARVVAGGAAGRSGTPSRSSAARAARAARAVGRIGAERGELGAALGPRQLGRGSRCAGRAPRPQLVGGDVAAPVAASSTATGHDLGELEHAPRRNVDALVPVVAEQLGVEGDDGARPARRDEVARRRVAGARGAALGVVGVAVVGPGLRARAA